MTIELREKIERLIAWLEETQGYTEIEGERAFIDKSNRLVEEARAIDKRRTDRLDKRAQLSRKIGEELFMFKIISKDWEPNPLGAKDHIILPSGEDLGSVSENLDGYIHWAGDVDPETNRVGFIKDAKERLNGIHIDLVRHVGPNQTPFKFGVYIELKK